MINYFIIPNVETHTFQVELRFVVQEHNHTFKLPTWIPGSYMIREFSKNITVIAATTANKAIHMEQINKNTWKLKQLIIGQEVIIQYSVYAYDNGIRASYLDHIRGYFNATSLCLYVRGYEDEPHAISLVSLPKNWKVATALPLKSKKYVAENYAMLIDNPFELGAFIRLSFMCNRLMHEVVLSGYIHPKFDSKRLLTDMAKICTAQLNMFGSPTPFDKYTFLLNLSGEVYTGLEHANSTALMAPYYSLPHLGDDAKVGDEYQKLLGLISHEYFHAWNVKRIKPQAFAPYDLELENYTTLLWWFEGVTSYYDDLMLYRAGLIDKKQYLQCIVDNINMVYKYAGATQQTLAESSLNTWIKYYRPDENTPNVWVSYYVKGALVAMCLDLLIRQDGKGKSLDDVLRLMYKHWHNTGGHVQENEIPQIILQATGCALHREINAFVHSCTMLPLNALLSKFGIKVHKKLTLNYTENGKVIKDKSELKGVAKIDLGCKLVQQPVGYKITHVYTNSAAAAAYLAANDVIIALDRVRITNWERQLSIYAVGDQIKITFFRGDQLLDVIVTIQSPGCNIYHLQIENMRRLSKWL